MKIKAALLSALIGASFNASASDNFQTYIVNGTDANITTFSSYIALFIDLIEYNQTYYVGSYCGATVLDEQHILTAAHCVYSTDHDNNLTSLFATAVPLLQNESDYPYSMVEKRRVSEIYYPDNYDDENLHNDIAILKLESSFSAIGSSDYAVMSDDGTTYRSTSEAFYAVGHGNTESGVDDVDVLQQAQLNYVPDESCNFYNIDGTKLCMEGEVSTSNNLQASGCQGDSGGPLYWYSGSQYIQVGVTSFGPGTMCGDPSYSATTVFTEVYDYQEWMTSVLNGLETPKYVVTDAKRKAYLNPGSSTPDPEAIVANIESHSGGSLGFLSAFLLGMAAVFRKKLA